MSATPPSGDQIAAAAGFIRSLTIGRIMLAFLFAVAGITVFALWEQRDAAMVTLAGSPILFGGVVLSVALMLLSVLVGAVIKYVDAQRDVVYTHLRDQIRDLRQEMEDVKERECECISQRFADHEKFNSLILTLVEGGSLERRKAEEFTQ